MHFFLLLFIPSFTFCLLAADSKYRFIKLSAPVFIGLFTGIISTVFIEFFIYPESASGSSFFSIIASVLAHTAVPSILLSVLFILFSKDDAEYKTYAILPLISMFFSIYVPYVTFTQGESKSFFMSFINPVLFMETIILYSCAIKYGFQNNAGKTKALKAIVLAISSLFIQPVFYSLWYIKFLPALSYLAAFILIPVSIFVYKFFSIQQNSLDNTE